MDFEWVSRLRLRENLGKVLALASMVVALGYIVLAPRAQPPGEQTREVDDSLREMELDKLSHKRTRKTFLSEEENENNDEICTLEGPARRRGALGNTYFRSDHEAVARKPKKEKVPSYADDQQLDKFHMAIGNSFSNDLVWR